MTAWRLRRSPGGEKVRRRLDDGRREELLDGIMGIMAARGFAGVRTSQMARELHCSETTLYKIAPSKDSLLVLALDRWTGLVLERAEARARQGKTASERARLYYLTTVESFRPLSLEFRRDVERFPSTQHRLPGRLGPFREPLRGAARRRRGGREVRPMNTLFLAQALRQLSLAIRDERALRASGLTTEEAALLVDSLIWDGIRTA